MNENSKKIRVFISYSHDSVSHEKEVLELANRLRDDGVDAWIDQYETSPPQGWPLWMASELERADYVVVVVTAEYQKRMSTVDPPSGKGVAWEGLIITQSLYDAHSQNSSFVPLLLRENDRVFIPTPLRPFSFESLEKKDGYEFLYRRLTNQNRIVVPELGPAIIYPKLGSIGVNRDQSEREVIAKYSIDWLDHPTDVTSVEDYYYWHETPEFWRTGAGEIFAISNREVEALWAMSRYATIYEVWLKRFINSGGKASRIYVLSEEYVNSNSFNLFMSAMYRHSFLGFKPRLAVFPDSEAVQKSMLGAKCDTYAVLNRDVCLLYQFPPNKYPMFVRTTHEGVIDRAIKAHDALLPKTISFVDWLSQKPNRKLPDAQLREIEAEAGRISEIAGSLGIE